MNKTKHVSVWSLLDIGRHGFHSRSKRYQAWSTCLFQELGIYTHGENNCFRRHFRTQKSRARAWFWYSFTENKSYSYPQLKYNMRPQAIHINPSTFRYKDYYQPPIYTSFYPCLDAPALDDRTLVDWEVMTLTFFFDLQQMYTVWSGERGCHIRGVHLHPENGP